MEQSDHGVTNAVDAEAAGRTAPTEPVPSRAKPPMDERTMYRSFIEGLSEPSALRSDGVARASAMLGARVAASECACGTRSACACGTRSASLVYALGRIDFDFGTEARRDSFLQQGVRDPHDPRQLAAHLQASPSNATAVIWTLTQDATPIYALRPAGPYAAETYERLRTFLNDQQGESVERVSIPGVVTGADTLLNGQVVPVIYPELRGMYSWSTKALLGAVLGKAPAASAKEDDRKAYEERQAGVRNFLERVYDEMRNLGLTPQERALNYAATNAFQVHQVFQQAIEEHTQLDTIEVEKSPVCRPGADCWDVKLTFFNPTRRLEQARKVYRFTVDVTDVVPVTVGTVRQWHIY